MADSPDAFDDDVLQAIATNRPAVLARYCKDPNVAALLETLTFDMPQGVWRRVRARVFVICKRFIERETDKERLAKELAFAFYNLNLSYDAFPTARHIIRGDIEPAENRQAAAIAFQIIKRALLAPQRKGADSPADDH